MKSNILVVLTMSIIIFSGCTTSVSELSAPDGSSINTVKCNHNSMKCLKEASESCSRAPYQVLTSESHAGGLVADWLAGPVTWYTMSYKCGTSDGTLPTFPFNGQQYVTPTIINNTTNIKSSPRPSFQRAVQTNCQQIGNNVNCTSF